MTLLQVGTRRDLSGDFVTNWYTEKLVGDCVTSGTQRDLSGGFVRNWFTEIHFRLRCYNWVNRKTCQLTLLQVVTQRDLSGEFFTCGYAERHFRGLCYKWI